MSDVTHQLKVYGSVFSPEPVEVYELPDGVILGEWLADNVKGFDAENSELAFSLPFNELVTCDVSCHVTPKKSVVSFIAPIFALPFVAFKQVMKLLTPSMASANSSQAQGSELDMASAQQQQVKYGQPIREAFGRTKIVPDYLVPPRRYFKDKKEHWMESLLCVGVGDHSFDDNDIKLSNTDLNAIGGGNYAKIYPPNADLTGDVGVEWWHTSQEVGPTSQGSSGLKLEVADEDQRSSEGGNYLFSGKTISTQSGQAWPQQWSLGMSLIVNVSQQYQFEAIDGPTYSGKLTGNFSGLDLEAGDTVEVSGDVRGSYTVLDFIPSTVTNVGTASVWTASSAPSLDYTSANAQFLVTCGTATGNFTLDSLYVTEGDLVDDLNAKLALTALSGLCLFSIGLVITEQQNYAARVITVDDVVAAANVFGDIAAANSSSLVGVARSEAGQAQLTLDRFSAYPVTTLAISESGDKYAITNISVGSINVEKVDSQGDAVPWDGWLDDVISFDPVIERDPQGLQTLWQGPFAATPGNELATHLEYDIFFPVGLYWTTTNGTLRVLPSSVECRYREDESQPWEYDSQLYAEAERDQIGFTHRITLPRPMRVKQCQVRRTRVSVQNGQNHDDMQWFGLRAKMARQVTRYPALTTMAVKVNGGSVSAQSDSEVSIVATRKLDGVPTRKISDAVKYIARNADIDIASFAPLDAIWDTRGDTFDFQFNKFTTVKSAANTALSAGFADFTVRDGLLTPIREAARPHELLYAFNHTYSAQNTTGDIVTQIKMPDPDEIDGYDVEYIDSNTWRVETVRCQQVGSLGNRIEKITADGITNRTKAYQWGMRALMTKLLDSMSISTKTELDAKNSNYGDYVSFVQEVPEWSQSAIVDSVNGLVLTSTEPLNWVAGAQHVVALQKPDGRMSELQDATQINEYQLSVSAPWSFIPTSHTTALFFGVKDRFATAAIVRNVKPSSNSATISASVYNADIYQYDDAGAPQ